MALYEYRILGHSDYESLLKGVTEAINAWADTWLGQFTNIDDIRVFINEDAENYYRQKQGAWGCYFSNNEFLLAKEQGGKIGEMSYANAISAAQCRDMNDDSTLSPIFKKLVANMEMQMAVALGAGIVSQNGVLEYTKLEDMPDIIGLPGSGEAVIEYKINGQISSWVLSAKCVNTWIGHNDHKESESYELVPVISAISGQSASLTVGAGIAELSLADLQNLKKGDVIKLDSKLDDPFSIFMDEKEMELSCHLGASHSNKVVRIVAMNGDNRSSDEVSI